MESKTVLVSAPIHQREWILPYYLEHIFNIDYPKSLIKIYWLINNCTDKSLSLLQQFKDENKHLYSDIIIEVEDSKDKTKDERDTEIREKHTYHWLSYCRGKILRKTYKTGCQYLLSCDSDILAPPNIIKDLMEPEVPVCASLLFNGYELFFNEFWKYPNILKKAPQGGYRHIVNYNTSNPSKADKDVLIPVDYTGACFLADVDTCKNSFYRWGKQGEDEVWSESVIASGRQMYCRPSVYSQHIMSPKFLEMYLTNTLPMR